MASVDPIGGVSATSTPHNPSATSLNRRHSPSVLKRLSGRHHSCGVTRSGHAGAGRLPVQRTAGSMPLFRMSGAASGADMNFTIMVAASGCFDTANTPAENTT